MNFSKAASLQKTFCSRLAALIYFGHSELGNWNIHNTDPEKLGQEVTEHEKIARAEEIADKLSNNNLWQSHGRPINIETLENELRLKIADYSNNQSLKAPIRSYYQLLEDYVFKNRVNIFVQTRKFI